MSATAALKTLRDALKRGTFDGAYYICGEDDFQKEDAMKQLIEAAIEPGMRDFNMEVKRGSEFDARSLDAALSAMPMLADRRVIVIRDAGTLRKDARKVLDAYLTKPSPDVLVLIVETSGAKTDKDLAANSTPLEFDYLTADRIPRWIAHHAATEFQIKISTDAADLLQTAVGTDLHQLVSELDKLASYANGREIQESDVTAVVGIRRGETMADLLDQVAMRNAHRSMELLSHILAQPKTTGVQLVMALSTQTIALAWGHAKRQEGLSSGRLQSEYFTLLKQSGAPYTGRTWGSAAAAWAAAVDRWTGPALDRALDALLDADVALKESRVSTEDQILATLILSMCVDDDEHSIAA
jgi:DNA polymerase-3 subunit delta